LRSSAQEQDGDVPFVAGVAEIELLIEALSKAAEWLASCSIPDEE
jgi:hypothetical protein